MTNNNSNNMIEIEHLQKDFSGTQVLKDISFEVAAGEVVAIIGPSGSGKSTLLRCLNYLEEPNGGVIRIGDVAVDTKKATKKTVAELRKQTSMVFQHYNLFKNKTVLENVTYALEVAQGFSKDAAKEKGLALLEKVGLADKADKYPVTLSGGQQQRVGIARAVAVNPKVILFDEPTSSLDPEWVAEVLQVISDIARDEQATMIIVTHEMNFAKEVADKVVFMSDGYIVESGEPEAVLENPQHERTIQFLQRNAVRIGG
ncbi:amino acid ABC transporter ATP-binding protein [Aerococcus viridans]|uniref:Amino acid ABC transporter ATP-binding protein n=2 Tax=Aerococcus viridans TaxID=1377 RepID=A0A2J9PLE4_9LACT|nr:amino acid ABC transporter ATP-binding protein [Aerococcus viridans]PNL91126.1 amino acid ABC transporter ATP-binding protein [Aerococcus viridans]